MSQILRAAIVFAMSAPVYPAGTVVDKLTLTATSNTNPELSSTVDAAPDATSIDIPNLIPDTYTVTLLAIGADGRTLASTGSVYVLTGDAPATISLSLPTGMTVSQVAG